MLLCFFLVSLSSAMQLVFAKQHQPNDAANLPSQPVKVSVEFRQLPIQILNDRFVSVADTCRKLFNHKCSKKFYKDYARLLKVSKPLTPAYLRVGGNSCDFTTYDSISNPASAPTGEQYAVCNKAYVDRNTNIHSHKGVHSCEGAATPVENSTITNKKWDKMYTYTRDAGFDLIFGINVVPNNGSGYWDPTNFVSLLKRIVEKGQRLSFELGNEPNSLEKKIGREVTPEELAVDFSILQELLSKYYEGNTFVIGPSVTRPHLDPAENCSYSASGPDYLRKFLQSGGGNYVDAITWHQYYFDGRTGSLANFTDPAIMNMIGKQLQIMNNIVKAFAPSKLGHVWLGETSTAYGGGVHNVSDRFVAGFLWLNKLGLSAASGLEVVVRQTLFDSPYALLDEDLRPSPDYWLTILYKRVVGRKVFAVNRTSNPYIKVRQHNGNANTRVFAHCAFGTNSSSIVLYGMNLDSSMAQEVLITNLAYTEVEAYILTAGGDGSLTSDSVKLNGQTLALASDGSVPSKFVPTVTDKVWFPPSSMGFFVIKSVALYGIC